MSQIATSCIAGHAEPCNEERGRPTGLPEHLRIGVALIVFGIVTIFTRIPHGDLIYAIAGLVIFAGITAFDFQRLRRTKDIRTAPLLAASIFLDILNVFLLFTSLFGGQER